ncbi:hypothetical protein GCM10027344_02510 [Spelaeicoccus albus]
MRGDPRKDVFRILLLLLEVFVNEATFGIAGPSQIHPNARIAVTCQIRMVDGVAFGREIALTIRKKFKYSGDRIRIGCARPPDVARKPGPVGDRDPDVFFFNDVVWKFVHNLHYFSALSSRAFFKAARFYTSAASAALRKVG